MASLDFFDEEFPEEFDHRVGEASAIGRCAGGIQRIVPVDRVDPQRIEAGHVIGIEFEPFLRGLVGLEVVDEGVRSEFFHVPGDHLIPVEVDDRVAIHESAPFCLGHFGLLCFPRLLTSLTHDANDSMLRDCFRIEFER